MKCIVTILVFSAAIYMVDSLCNVCSGKTGLACVDHNKFKVCVNGVPTPPAITCPTGTLCTPNAQVCAPEATAISSCARCNKCDGNGIFACTEYGAFSLCLGNTDEPPAGAPTFHCPGNLVCNIDTPGICVDKTGIGATCPWTETTTAEPATTEAPATTTPSPETQSDEYCENLGFPGRYEIASDRACQKYINCLFLGGAWIGNVYECPSATYFNQATQMCGSEKPTRCS